MTGPASAGRFSSLRTHDWSERQWRIGLALLALATFALRLPALGYPLIDVDEEFYLLVGDRMLHGAIPYVDIWDRKPPGLFALYAAIRLLGGQGIVQYQIVAALFATATTLVIATLARRVAHPLAALAAALAYAPTAALIGGRGGQTPIFYNLLVILAVWILLDLFVGRPDRATIRRRGTAAMLLIGVAMQIKPTPVFEGAYLGLVLLWLSHRAGSGWGRLAADAAIWIATAMAPSFLAWALYARMGHSDAFLYSNVFSIFARSDGGAGSPLVNLGKIALRIAPFLVGAIVGEWLLRDRAPWHRSSEGVAAHLFLFGWLLAALFGFGIFGTYFDHYALPLLPPLAISTAVAFSISRNRAGVTLAALTALFLAIRVPLDLHKLMEKRGDTASSAQMAQAIAEHLNGGCLYIFYGEPIYYHLTHACMPTRWPFPFHLSLLREAGALGVDAEAETRRILATRPTVIVDRLNDDDEINFRTQAILRAGLRRDYKLVYTATHHGRYDDSDQVWALR